MSAAPQTPPMEAPMVDWALWYAGRGMRVFPVYEIRDGRCSCDSSDCRTRRSEGKPPRIANNLASATVDPDVIRGWWSRWPNANIGTPTGDSYIVVDVDPRNSGDDTLRRLEIEHGNLPPSP